MGKWTRRAFIGAGSLVGGGFVLGVAGFTFAPNRLTVRAQAAGDGGQLNTWILITPDGTVTVLVPHCEMGQGTQTALAMMAAEEMNADWKSVRVKEAPALDAYANAYIVRAFLGDGIPRPLARGFDYGTYRLASWYGTQMTGGSLSVRSTGHFGMRVAGAAAREMLIAAAAARFNVKAADCKALNSRVMHSSGVEATFGELAAEAAKMAVPAHPTPKDPSTYTIRRTPRPRFDIPSKVNGTAIYGIDFKVPGMKYAAVEIAPVYGGKLTSVDSVAVEKMPGVLKVVRLDEAVAVVADSYWQARKAAEALKPEWSDAGHGSVTTASIFSAFDQSLGAPPDMPKDAAKVIAADYTVPFLAHATMEPMVCTAKVEGDRCEVWAGVQDPLNARGAASKALKMDVEHVQFTNLLLGGGFGRRLPYTYDYIDLGCRIAKAMSPVPVKLIWSRENDIQHDYYRPAGMSRFAGALDQSGAPLAVASHYAGGGDGESTFMPYAIPSKNASAKDAAHPIRTGAWRSVLNSQHGFFKESFIDEMAHAAGKDPYQFRRDLLSSEPRFLTVLDRVAKLSNWGSPLPAREGRGIAITACFGDTVVGEVAHVAVSPEGKLRVREMFVVVDCGDVVNPDSAKAQAEGGVIFGLSAALLGEITIKDGRVEQHNFNDHEMIHIADAPQVTAEFVQSTAPLGGLGEPCVPPVAPAVANAIFAATGIRVRALPIKNTSLAAPASRLS